MSRDVRVDALADDLWDAWMAHEPLTATVFGVAGHDDRLSDLSAEAQAAFAGRCRDVARRAAGLPLTELAPADRTTARYVAWLASAMAEADVGLGSLDHTVSAFWVASLSQVLAFAPMAPVDSPAAARAYLSVSCAAGAQPSPPSPVPLCCAKRQVWRPERLASYSARSADL